MRLDGKPAVTDAAYVEAVRSWLETFTKGATWTTRRTDYQTERPDRGGAILTCSDDDTPELWISDMQGKPGRAEISLGIPQDVWSFLPRQYGHYGDGPRIAREATVAGDRGPEPMAAAALKLLNVWREPFAQARADLAARQEKGAADLKLARELIEVFGGTLSHDAEHNAKTGREVDCYPDISEVRKISYHHGEATIEHLTVDADRVGSILEGLRT